MSSAAPESESAELLPSQGRVSDHDPSGDERVVTVEPETAAAASSAAPSDASSPIGSKSDDMSGIVGPLKSTLEGLKFQIACMPVLRLKVCPEFAAILRFRFLPPLPLQHWPCPLFSSHQQYSFQPISPDAQDQEQ
jgi:hypothetical protein